MWRCIILVFLCSLAPTGLVFAESSPLSANQWSVQSSSGDVSTAAVGTDRWQRLETGHVLTSPFTIRTGPTGQVVLVRGDDTVLVSPGSELEVQAARYSDAGLITRILQSIGSLVYKVEKRTRQRFEVETPYLVSVVKGTTFTISVSKRDTVVSLQEGSLEVLSIDGSQRALMEPGEIARTIQGMRGIDVINVQPQRSQWGSWHPANTKRDAGHRTKPGSNVARVHASVHARHSSDRSGSATGLPHTPHGRSDTPHRLSSHTPPGLSRTPPGLSRTLLEIYRTRPGESRHVRSELFVIPPELSERIPPGLNK